MGLPIGRDTRVRMLPKVDVTQANKAPCQTFVAEAQQLNAAPVACDTLTPLCHAKTTYEPSFFAASLSNRACSTIAILVAALCPTAFVIIFDAGFCATTLGFDPASFVSDAVRGMSTSHTTPAPRRVRYSQPSPVTRVNVCGVNDRFYSGASAPSAPGRAQPTPRRRLLTARNGA